MAVGQIHFSTVHEFMGDEIANNCSSASRCRSIRLHHRLRHYELFFLLSNETVADCFRTRLGEHTKWDKTSASVWCSSPPVAVVTMISLASSWPQSHLGAPPSLSQGAFQWGGFCGGMVADSLSPLRLHEAAAWGPERVLTRMKGWQWSRHWSFEYQVVSQYHYHSDVLSWISICSFSKLPH